MFLENRQTMPFRIVDNNKFAVHANETKPKCRHALIELNRKFELKSNEPIYAVDPHSVDAQWCDNDGSSRSQVGETINENMAVIN